MLGPVLVGTACAPNPTPAASPDRGMWGLWGLPRVSLCPSVSPPEPGVGCPAPHPPRLGLLSQALSVFFFVHLFSLLLLRMICPLLLSSLSF